MRTNNKFIYEYILQGKYDGQWSDLTAAPKNRAGWKEVAADRKDYRENEGGAYRIISRRTKKTLDLC